MLVETMVCTMTDRPLQVYHGGVNDSCLPNPYETHRPVPVWKYKAILRSIIEIVPEETIVVFTTALPLAVEEETKRYLGEDKEFVLRRRADTAEYSQGVREVAMSCGKPNVLLVDTELVLLVAAEMRSLPLQDFFRDSKSHVNRDPVGILGSSNSSHSIDVHLNDRGYLVFEQSIASAIDSALRLPLGRVL